MRTGNIDRKTSEASVSVTINLDGSGVAEIETPVEFLNHMLRALSVHSMIDIRLKATGDLRHHIVEDAALCLGKAVREALVENQAIYRFGDATVPMDCSAASCAVDLGGRPYHVVSLDLKGNTVEDMAAEDLTHFFESLATSLAANIHIKVHYGFNDHHRAEAAFKALALSLRQALAFDPRRKGVPSSKGVL
jgi:imidazoleglycerol-phosphate dehydratase